MSQDHSKKITIRYLVLTFALMGITWGGIFIAQQFGYLTSDSVVFFPLYIAGGASATIASFVVLTQSGITVKEWLKNVFGFKQKFSHYFIVVFLLACYITLGYLTNTFKLMMPLSYILLYSLTGIVEGGLEEAGWRYILQANLEKSMSFCLATITTSTVWVLWHFPLFFINGTAQRSMNFSLFFIFFIGYSFSLAAIRKLTGSIWLCVLFHSALNAILTVFALQFRLTETILISSIVTLISLFLLKRFDKQKVT